MKKTKSYKLRCECGHYKHITNNMLEGYRQETGEEFVPLTYCTSCFTSDGYFVSEVTDEE